MPTSRRRVVLVAVTILGVIVAAAVVYLGWLNWRLSETIVSAPWRDQRALDAPVAWLTHDLLRGVVVRGTASRLADEGLDHVAGRTGTATAWRDAWFVGYAPDLVTGLWIGCDGGAPLRLSAAEAAVPLWARI